MGVQADSNDTRGWIMCVVSGIACVIGASVICVDILVRQIPGQRAFTVRDSEVFLASSLSLTFGVMIYSALTSMLPSSRKYLIIGGLDAPAAAWTLAGCFVAGFVGLQIVSRFIHRFIPSHVVDCDHSHQDAAADGHGHHQSQVNSYAGGRSRRHSHGAMPHAGEGCKVTESTPLLQREGESAPDFQSTALINGSLMPSDTHRRPSIMDVQNRVISFVKDTKNNCDENGPCYGYSEPCGQECLKYMATNAQFGSSRRTNLWRNGTADLFHKQPSRVVGILEDDIADEIVTSIAPTSIQGSRDHSCEREDSHEFLGDDLETQHHHHVPQNAFMSIGLQTSIAIALHKLPEGFITYATNHASPSLGLTIFMALFIHNITEGFAMALPLYLALGSRVKAMIWSSLLGGLSQPMGAGIAAVWFKLANGHHDPGFPVYGGMFAVTAGIMTSVALSLFVESLSMNHNSRLCIAFALIGMSIIGISNALTA